MNREKAFRLKMYEVLTSAPITYDSGQVSIWDEKAEDTTNNLYILFQGQTAQFTGTFCNNTWNCTIDLVLVNKQPDTISKDTTDDIGEQIETLLNDGLIAGAEYGGWQITNFQLDSINYASYVLSQTSSELEKTMTYRATLTRL